MVTAYTSTVNPVPAAYCMFQNTDASEIWPYKPNANPSQSVQRLTLTTVSFGSDSIGTSFYPGCILFCQIICLWVELKIVHQILPQAISSAPVKSLCVQTRRESESIIKCIRKAINLLSPLLTFPEHKMKFGRLN